MAVKTITIDLEAYDALARQKRPGQSFSQVIKAHFGPPKNARAFRQAVRELGGLSVRTLAGIDTVAASRRRSRARVPSL
jgi:predicted CopG family antitoxin